MLKMIRRVTLTALICSFLWILTQLAAHFHEKEAPPLPTHQGAVELYSNQTEDDLTQVYKQAIESAQQSITLAIYGLHDATLIRALKNKCASGIPVHIVCDSEASEDISKRLPEATIVIRSSMGLMHQKILIVDERLILLGSANLTYSSLNLHGNLVVGIDHPSLAKALADRTKSMDEEGAFTPLLHQEMSIGNQKVEMWVLPDNPTASSRLIDLFRAAKKSITVAMFTWTRNDFTKELIAASLRGVKVEAIIDRNAGHGCSAKIVQMLKNGGIPVCLSTGQGLLHHKFAYIDESILVNGSANWTLRAFQENDDSFVILDPLTPKQKEKMDALCEVIRKQSEQVANNQ